MLSLSPRSDLEVLSRILALYSGEIEICSCREMQRAVTSFQGAYQCGPVCVCTVQGCRKGSSLCQPRARASQCIPVTERPLLLCTSSPLQGSSCSLLLHSGGYWCYIDQNCSQLEKSAFFLMQHFFLLLLLMSVLACRKGGEIEMAYTASDCHFQLGFLRKCCLSVKLLFFCNYF